MGKNKKQKAICVKIEGIPEVSMEELIEGCTRDIEMYLKRFDKFHSFYAISLSMALVPFAILVIQAFWNVDSLAGISNIWLLAISVPFCMLGMLCNRYMPNSIADTPIIRLKLEKRRYITYQNLKDFEESHTRIQSAYSVEDDNLILRLSGKTKEGETETTLCFPYYNVTYKEEITGPVLNLFTGLLQLPTKKRA